MYCFYFIFSVFSIFSFYPIFRCYLVRLFLQVYLLISDWQRRTLVLRRKSLLLWGVIWCMVGLWQPTLPLDTVHSSICHFSPRASLSRALIFPSSSREIVCGVIILSSRSQWQTALLLYVFCRRSYYLSPILPFPCPYHRF